MNGQAGVQVTIDRKNTNYRLRGVCILWEM